jgi:endonuclease-3
VEDRARKVAQALWETYPAAKCELDYETPWQLLVATVLSAQCTDQRVNQVTPELFRRMPGPEDLADARVGDVEEIIRSTGLFRNKAKNLRETARRVVRDHSGQVPRDFDQLLALPGVGRKTAKVVLGEAFGIAAGIAVDTHVNRLAGRIGLTGEEDPQRVADELEELLPRDLWIGFSLRLILHGRRVCTARGPRCDECCLRTVCLRIGVAV